MIKAAVIACASVAVLLTIASVVCFLLSIWHGDSRWGQTGLVFVISALGTGFTAGVMKSFGMPDD